MERRPPTRLVSASSPRLFAGAFLGTLALGLISTPAVIARIQEPAARLARLETSLDDSARLLRTPIEDVNNTAPPPAAPSRNVRVAGRDGRTLIARVHGDPAAGILLLPDGQIAWTHHPVFVDEPFVPLTKHALLERLKQGPLAHFDSIETDHYLILYESSRSFAESSARLLESLYAGLMRRFKERGFDVHEAEFPLVAIVFANEANFRAHRAIDPAVEAYYDVVTNQITLYESKPADALDPATAAMRKPQTVAHEGTHQILQNIGVQPRLAAWPLWVIEGLAELASTHKTNGGEWAGPSHINPFHIATLEDLIDETLQTHNAQATQVAIGHDWRRSLVRYLMHRDQLTPTDYALAWTLTHYLANARTDNFMTYLKDLGKRLPGVKHSIEEDEALFAKHFGTSLQALEAQVSRHVEKMRGKVFLGYYAVTFEQQLGGNLVRRGTLVSRSPQIIREWVEQRMPDPRGGPYVWNATPFRSRAMAARFVEQWINSR